MLEFDDIQHILLTRHPRLAARYGFLRFAARRPGASWLAGIIDKVQSAAGDAGLGATRTPAG